MLWRRRGVTIEKQTSHNHRGAVLVLWEEQLRNGYY